MVFRVGSSKNPKQKSPAAVKDQGKKLITADQWPVGNQGSKPKTGTATEKSSCCAAILM